MSLRYEELETVLIGNKGILNSSPLTFADEQITELPITRSYFDSGCRLVDALDI